MEKIQKPRNKSGAEIPAIDRTAAERVAAIDAEIVAAEANIAAVQERREAAEERLSALNSEYAALRAERGAALAAGEDATAITKRLKKVGEEREAVEDELGALSPILPDLAEKRKALAAARKTAAGEVARAALRVAARRYNSAAAELVPILQDLWRCQAAANEGITGRVAAAPAGWDQGALDNLPRVYVDEDGPPLNEVKRDGFYWASHRDFVASAAMRQQAAFEAKQAEIEASRAAAGETVDAAG